MEVRENVLLRSKTTMRIGGTVRYFLEITTKEDVDAAVDFAAEKGLPLFFLGSGSNTIFADGTINAVVAQLKYADVHIEGNRTTVGAGKNLPMLINELAEQGLDLSPLTGIPGTIGGAIFGNAGQGPKGVWMDSFIETVIVRMDDEWKTLPCSACGFAYRESLFKHHPMPVFIWEAELRVPSGEPASIQTTIQTLLQKRIETQPHMKTAGSCFKAVGGVPAWQLIDSADLRGYKVGGIEVSTKHANFLMNTGEGSYADAVNVVEEVRSKIPEKLEVEMRFVETDGSARF